MARASSPLAEQLGAPGWLASFLFAAAVTAAICYPAWPGFMSYDSLFAYQQARHGVQTMLWPPLHTYMFQLSEAVGARTWGVFVFQTFTLFASAAVTLHLLIRNRALAFLAAVGFVGLIVLSPAVLGSLFVHWRDVPTASFALMGLALWLLAARQGQPLLLAPAAAAFGCAVALRYNAFALVAFLLVLMIWSPLLGRPARFARPFAVVCVAAALGLAWASTQWRLPDLMRMPAPANFAATQEFDLIGVSACADRNYLPPAITEGDLSAYHIRRNYDPRHLLLTLKPKPGTAVIKESDGAGAVQRVWPQVVAREPVCYLSHRLAVFVEQMGLAEHGVFYPTHGMIDPNGFGLAVAHPQDAKVLVDHIAAQAGDTWRRPAWLYLLAVVLAGAAMLRERAHAPLLLALLAGAFAYPALLFVASPAADARYVFPPNIACALIAMASLGLLLDPPEGPLTAAALLQTRGLWQSALTTPETRPLKPLLPPLAVFALISLAACDQPKPRPAEPQDPAAAAAPAPAAPVAASAGLAKRAEMAAFSLDVINEAKDPLNTLATISAEGPVTFTGFGFDPVAKAPAGAVDLVIDGVAYPTAYGHQRKDVADYFKTPALENSGFTVTLPAGAIKPGQHLAIVRVVAADKAGYFDSVAIGFVAQ